MVLVDLASATSNVVHALQRERGATSLFVTSQGQQFGAELAGYRGDTDEVLAALTDYVAAQRGGLPESVLTAADSGLGQLERLGQVRANADTLQTPVPELIGYYTGTITDLLGSLAPMVAASTSPAQTRDLAGLMSLLDAKEQTGIERAQLSNVFAKDAFGDGQLVAVASLAAARAADLGTFVKLADPAIAAEYERVSAGPAFTAVAEAEALALGRPDGGFGADPAEWFATATKMIDGLKEVEDAAAALIHAEAVAVRDAAQTAMLAAAVLTLVAVLVTLGLAAAIITSITRPLRATVEVLDALAEGQLDRCLDVDPLSQDEVPGWGGR